jgi:hypothetical protein
MDIQNYRGFSKYDPVVVKVLEKAGITAQEALTCSTEALSLIFFEKASAVADKRLLTLTERLPYMIDEFSFTQLSVKTLAIWELLLYLSASLVLKFKFINEVDFELGGLNPM